MGGLACGAMCATMVGILNSTRVAHQDGRLGPGLFTHGHEGGKYSFEVGPSIFEGLDKPSLNPLRILLDILDSELPVETLPRLGLLGAHLQFRRDGAGAVVAFSVGRSGSARAAS